MGVGGSQKSLGKLWGSDRVHQPTGALRGYYPIIGADGFLTVGSSLVTFS